MKPMFQVDAVLIASEVVLRPSPAEIYNIILQNGRNLLEQMKLYPRWMNGTCLECKPLRKTENDAFLNFTFFEDLMSIQASDGGWGGRKKFDPLEKKNI